MYSVTIILRLAVTYSSDKRMPIVILLQFYYHKHSGSLNLKFYNIHWQLPQIKFVSLFENQNQSGNQSVSEESS